MKNKEKFCICQNPSNEACMKSDHLGGCHLSISSVLVLSLEMGNALTTKGLFTLLAKDIKLVKAEHPWNQDVRVPSLQLASSCL